MTTSNNQELSSLSHLSLSIEKKILRDSCYFNLRLQLPRRLAKLFVFFSPQVSFRKGFLIKRSFQLKIYPFRVSQSTTRQKLRDLILNELVSICYFHLNLRLFIHFSTLFAKLLRSLWFLLIKHNPRNLIFIRKNSRRNEKQFPPLAGFYTSERRNQATIF